MWDDPPIDDTEHRKPPASVVSCEWKVYLAYGVMWLLILSGVGSCTMLSHFGQAEIIRAQNRDKP